METYSLVQPKVVISSKKKRKRKGRVKLTHIPENSTIYVCTECRYENYLNPTQYVVCQECRCRILEKQINSEKRVVEAL